MKRRPGLETYLASGYLVGALIPVLLLGIYQNWIARQWGAGPWRIGIDADLSGALQVAAAVLIAGLAGSLWARRLARPLQRFPQAIEALIAGRRQPPVGTNERFVPREIDDLYDSCGQLIADLYRTLQHNRDQMARIQMLQRVTASIHSSLDLQVILAETGKELKRTFGHLCTLIWPAQPGAFPTLLDNRCLACPLNPVEASAWQALYDHFSGCSEGVPRPLLAAEGEDSPHLEAIQRVLCARVTALMALPLAYHGELLGWLLVVHCHRIAPWKADDVELVQAIAVQLATAIHQALQHQRIRELNVRLAEMDRFKTNLIDCVSHDLRSPLTSIQGYLATLLRADASWDEKTRKQFLKTAYQQCQRLAGLVDDLLLVMSREGQRDLSLDLQPIDLPGVVDELIPLYSPRDIAADMATGLPPVLADRRRLEQVLMNLLDNACKYSPPGSPVTLAARPGTAGERVEVTIANFSEPIAPAEVGRLFEKFRRLKYGHSDGSSGLGLYISRWLTEAMGGRISAEFRDERFQISLSLPAPAEPVASAAPVSGAPAAEA